MSIEFYIIFLLIGLPLSLLYNYKFASQLTNAYFFRKLSGQVILIVLAFAEYFYFTSFAMSVISMSFIAWEILKGVCILSIIAYLVITKKVDKKDLQIYGLLFTQLKMRNLCNSENPNIYFFKHNGINVYFDISSDNFQSLHESYFDRFKANIKEEKSKYMSFDNFLVLHCGDNYISVSSDDLSLVGVDIFNLDKNHFDVLSMLKI
jgi:hypothetical protein